jgi:hypothetical protein
MPKAFLTHCYDVLSETTKCLAINSSQTELADALAFIPNLEKNSVTLYDRAYFSRTLCEAHFAAGNFFIARCQSNANAEVASFFKDAEKEQGGMYFETKQGAKKIWFLKIVNSKNNEIVVFATNLPRSWRNKKLFDQLYQLRWGAETSFYELSETVKLEQWHSKSYNGILQELYTTLLLINLVKIMSFFARGQKTINPESSSYRKANFKLLLNFTVDFMATQNPQLNNLIYSFQLLIKRSTEKRLRRSRTHPREIRSPASPYPYNNTEWRWGKGYGLI